MNLSEERQVHSGQVVHQHARNDDVKKELWLEIATNPLRQGHYVNEVFNLTKVPRVMRVEDLLLRFNEIIKIEDFKDKISESLKHYGQKIELL